MCIKNRVKGKENKISLGDEKLPESTKKKGVDI